MSLITLKSNLSEYKPKIFNEETVSIGNNKLITPNKRKSEINLIDMSSNYSKVGIDKNIRENKIPDKNKVIDDKWIVEKEIYDYKSIFEVLNPNNDNVTSKSTKLKTINLVKPEVKNDLVLLNSRFDNSLDNIKLEIKDKKSNVDINKVEYDLDSYKSDIVLDDINTTNVITNSIANRILSYDINEIDYKSQSKLINVVDNSSIYKESQIQLNQPKIIDIVNIYDDKKYKFDKFGTIELEDKKVYNSLFDIDKIELDKNNILDNKIPILNIYDNEAKNKKSTIDIVNNSEISGRFENSDIDLRLIKNTNLQSMDSLFDNLVNFNNDDLVNLKTNNTELSIKILNGVNYLNDFYQSNFKLFQNNSSFNTDKISLLSFNSPISINDFDINIIPFETKYNIKDSRLSLLDIYTVDYINNNNAIGFTYKQSNSEYNIDSTSLRWKGNNIPTTNFIDVKNQFSTQFIVNHSDTNYDIESTSLRWKGNNINVVNYLDIENKNAIGFTLKTDLETKYNMDSTSLRWKGNNINSVNYLDIESTNQSGFILRTDLESKYNMDSTSLRWKGNNISNVNYLDKGLKHTNNGFELFTKLYQSDLIKDSSVFDFDGGKNDAPTVNYLDISNKNQLGFNKFPISNVTNYNMDSTSLRWKGDNIPSINYIDVASEFQSGFIIKTDLETKYNMDSTSLRWKGDNINNVNYLDIENKNAIGFTLKTDLETKYNIDSTSLRWKGNNINVVNYLDIENKNAIGFKLNVINLETLFNNDTSDLVWKGNNINSVNYLDIENKNAIGFTLKTDLETKYNITSTIFTTDTNKNVDFITSNISGFGLRFTDVNSSNFKDIESNFNKILNSKYSNEDKYSYGDTDNSIFKTEEYLNIFKVPSELYVSNFSKQGSTEGINYIEDVKANGFITKQIDKINTNYKVDNRLNEISYVLNDIVYDKDNKYTQNNSEYDIKPQFDSMFKQLYTTNRISELAYNVDALVSEPYIRRGLMNEDILGPERYGFLGVTYDEGLVRGGITTQFNRQQDDMKRIGRFMASGRGLFFLGRQTLLQRTNPNVETYPDDSASNVGGGFFGDVVSSVKKFFLGRPTQNFNPISILDSYMGLDGERPLRHGMLNNGVGDVLNIIGTGIGAVGDLLGLGGGNSPNTTDTDAIARGNYESIAKKRNEISDKFSTLKQITAAKSADDEGNDNRLLMLTKELFPDWLISDMTQTNFNQPAGPTTTESFFNSVKKVAKKVMQTYIPTNLPNILGGTDFSESSDDVYIGKTIFRLSGNNGPGSRSGIGGTNIRRYTITNSPKNIEYHIYTPNQQYASAINTNYNLSSTRTRGYDENQYTMEDRDDQDTVFNLAKMLTELIQYDVNNYKYILPNSKQIIRNPFKTMKGAMGSTIRRVDDYKLRVDEALQMRNNKEDYVYKPKFEELASSPDFEPTSNKQSYVTSNNFKGSRVDNALGDYVAFKYKDLQKAAKEVKENRYKYNYSLGGFSLLNSLYDGDIPIEYTDRLKFITMFKNKTESDSGFNRVLVRRSTGNQGATSHLSGSISSRVDRSNPYHFKFPKGKIDSETGVASTTEEWQNVLKNSRGDKINLIDVIKNTSKSADQLYRDANKYPIKDYIKLVFSTANYNPVSDKNKGNNTVLIFRATMESLSDSFSPSWSPSDVMGRGEKVYMYDGYSREVSFNFKVVATSLEEQFTNWRKINELATFTTPDFGPKGNNRMMGPVMRLTVGDLFLGVPGFLSSLGYTYDFTNNFELAGYDKDGINVAMNKGVLQLPTIIDISVGYTIIGNYRAERGGKTYELRNAYGHTYHPNGADEGDYLPSDSQKALDSLAEGDSLAEPTTQNTTEAKSTEAEMGPSLPTGPTREDGSFN